MVKTRAPTGPRSADGRRFEVFIRETASEPLRHVGTVAAPTPETAHEEATALFGWTARDIWVCAAESTHRYTNGSRGDTDGHKLGLASSEGHQ